MKFSDILKLAIHNQYRLLADLRVKKKLSEYAKQNDITELYGKVHSDFDPVFVLSTGRCGTAFLTNLLQLKKDLQVFHEAYPEFFYHSGVAYKEHLLNNDKVSAIFDVARYELIRNTYIEGKKFIETNNRITFFAHQIAALYPNSKFIHLVRNPTSFVKSGLARNWYSGKSLYDEGRIRPDHSDWNNWSQIEKILWLWNETNSFAEEFKKGISADRFLFIKSEDLFRSPEVQNSIFDFIGSDRPSDVSMKRRTSRKINEGAKYSLTQEQKEFMESQLQKFPLRFQYGYK